MNTWASYPELLEYVEMAFKRDLERNRENLATCEYVLPMMMDELITEGEADIKIIYNNEKWIGITYKEDSESARALFDEMLENGVYPKKLWEK